MKFAKLMHCDVSNKEPKTVETVYIHPSQMSERVQSVVRKIITDKVPLSKEFQTFYCAHFDRITSCNRFKLL